MTYTAIEEMRKKNSALFGCDIGPKQPGTDTYSAYDLKSSALRFIHDRCEGLLFNEEIAQEEHVTGKLMGKSLKAGQIPYNMQMDINRLCLARELERFLNSGTAPDAYNVFYCWYETVFGRYGKSKKMIEMLSDYESNGGFMLTKLRDHYVHSVYVFTLGLAIYETNTNFQAAYKRFYHFDPDVSNTEQDHAAARHFLIFWGMTALLHDIGYPLEIPYEQAASYFDAFGFERGINAPYMIYQNLDQMICMSDEEKNHFQKLYGQTFSNANELLAHVVTQYLSEDFGLTEEQMYRILKQEGYEPYAFKNQMDHGYFGAIRLYREIVSTSQGLSYITKVHMDCLGAILLHNLIYKYKISFCKDPDLTKRKPPLRMEAYPFAFLLFLCDELQNWDRIAYGRNTRRETHPYDIEVDLRGNELRTTFIFDSDDQEKIDEFLKAYRAWEGSGETEKAPKLKEFGEMFVKEQPMAREIASIVDTSGIPLTISAQVRKPDRRNKHMYLSSSNFLHLYDFAVALNARYNHHGKESEIPTEQLEAEFESLSLEYQISNINQAKSFAEYLNAIGCFYTDKPVDYDMLMAFTKNQVEIIGPMEHERWIREKSSMGWQKGDFYKSISPEEIPAEYGDTGKKKRDTLREQLRMHDLAMDGEPTGAEITDHYNHLIRSEKEKDYMPLNSMMKLIKKFDGLRIYRLS